MSFFLIFLSEPLLLHLNFMVLLAASVANKKHLFLPEFIMKPTRIISIYRNSQKPHIKQYRCVLSKATIKWSLTPSPHFSKIPGFT